MATKRKTGNSASKGKRSGKKSAPQPRRSAPKENSRNLPDSILAALFKEGKSAPLARILELLPASGKNAIQKQLSRMLTAGDLRLENKKYYKLAEDGRFFSGKLEKHPHGFGFVTNLKPPEKAVKLKKDPFLSAKKIGSATHGDRVLIRLLKSGRNDRPEADLIAVLERGAETIVGFFRNGKPPVVEAEDPRFPDTITITGKYPKAIEDNTVVLVRILPGTTPTAKLSGKIEEVFGPADNVDVQMRIVIENHSLPYIFPDEVLRESERLTLSPKEYKDRLDLRDTCHVTIDGETAKDFDDAVCVIKTRKGFRLYVSIADVSHFVKPGSPLDREAYQRGTSVYFPGRVIPMLPENLSNNLCSLLPQTDRLTFTAILDFDRAGNLLKKDFAKSVICSKNRFTYTTVRKILIDRDPTARREHKEFLTPLKWAQELAEQLLEQRMKRGSIGFNIPEPEIELDEQGKISTITKSERNFAHQLIEEFMLVANSAVAELFTQKKREFLYRIHEKPSAEKIAEFKTFATTIGLELPKSDDIPEPSWFNEVLHKTEGTPFGYVVNNLLLRTMQQARYAADNQGHFGLASSDYTHFTSPIRRYPDLIVHRLLADFLKGKDSSKRPIPLEETAQHCSTRERVAVAAEREMNDRLKVFYLEHHIGETFRGVISGLIESTLFIELSDLFISGAIDVSELRDDYYLFDSRRYRFIGEISGKTYAMGDEIEVKLTNVDLRNRRISFLPASFS